MAYENGKTYWIVPADNQQVALNVYGNGQVSQNRNVNLWQRHATADQLWLVEVDPGGGFARIKTRLDTAYALNIWLGADDYGNCDLHTWRDNTNDSKVNFLTVDAAQNRYRIQCYRNDADNDLFLTAESTASGANVRWTARDDQALQVWDLVEYTGDAGGSGTGGWNGSRHIGSLIAVTAQNQYGAPYNQYSSVFQSNACYIASLISAANGLGREASLAQAMAEGCVTDAYRNGYSPGYVFRTPSFITVEKNQPYTAANIYRQVRQLERPVLVYGYSAARQSGHYAVVYYTTATDAATLTSYNTFVMDSALGWVPLQKFLNLYSSNLSLAYCS